MMSVLISGVSVFRLKALCFVLLNLWDRDALLFQLQRTSLPAAFRGAQPDLSSDSGMQSEQLYLLRYVQDEAVQSKADR